MATRTLKSPAARVQARILSSMKVPAGAIARHSAGAETDGLSPPASPMPVRPPHKNLLTFNRNAGLEIRRCQRVWYQQMLRTHCWPVSLDSSTKRLI
ncbi:hypothetical protein O9992_20220 [Vibrio lentus]|nr:hypothetical protein [Vibrio lentus]